MGAQPPKAPPVRPQAYVPWRALASDLVLVALGILAMAVSFCVDANRGTHDCFARSGAIAALLSGIVAYRSLNKHYRKFLNYADLAQVPTTSRNQRIVDWLTLCLSIIGTLVWGYGDILFNRFVS